MRTLPAFFFLFLSIPSIILAQDSSLPPWALEVSGQANSITQGDFNFHSPYSGANSLPGTHEVASSCVFTLFTRVTIPRNTDIEVDLESAGGSGIGDALGLAAYTNLDVVRNPALGAKPYLARAVLHHAIGGETTQGWGHVDFYAGQFSTVDWFDGNMVGSDSHTQFMNWAVDNNAAYDYAADTRGYTRGVVMQWAVGRWELRAGEMMLPTVANGLDLSWSWNTHSENLEVQRHTSLLGRNGSLRALTFINHANMGNYREAVTDTPGDEAPDITRYRHPGAVKYGFGGSFEQEITSAVRGYVRMGWNEGHNESFVYTEANSAVSAGMDVRFAKRWKSGLAVASDGISADHQHYLARGGMGFLLGDGGLNYGREQAVETYANVSLGRGLSLAMDVQCIVNPGYNRDRGPVWVPGFRLHWDSPKWRKSL
jgi:high affinity Mn2+ porin